MRRHSIVVAVTTLAAVTVLAGCAYYDDDYYYGRPHAYDRDYGYRDNGYSGGPAGPYTGDVYPDGRPDFRRRSSVTGNNRYYYDRFYGRY